MRFAEANTVKLALVCSAALAMIPTTGLIFGEETRYRLPGSHVGLEEAVTRSYFIETAEIVAHGVMLDSVVTLIEVKLRPTSVLKGAPDPGDQPQVYLFVSDGEAIPGVGEECIFFFMRNQEPVREGRVVKVLRKTEANLQAIKDLARDHKRSS
jgi:hypothetical protein